MPDFNTEFIQTLFNPATTELFRSELEAAINALLKTELAAFLGYEKHDSDGWNTGNSRNGYYKRTLATRYGELHLEVPRDRNGDFHSPTLPRYLQHTNALETTVIQLYQRGVTTRQIADLIEQMYGRYYSPATISHISSAVTEQVQAFHSRQVAARYAVIFCDATYLNLRRDSVAKEALHVLLGITPEGNKEVLDYAIYPSESATNYAEMLQGLKTRGLKDVLLFVSDGLVGLPDAVKQEFPQARHQSCWVHLARAVARLVRQKDRKEVLAVLKEVYHQDDAEAARQALEAFLERFCGKYPRPKKVFQLHDSLFTFYEFPQSIRPTIYTSNLIENNNKGLKHHAKLKEQFPNEESLERFVCTFYSEYNRKQGEKAHRGFREATAELLDMFPKP